MGADPVAGVVGGVTTAAAALLGEGICIMLGAQHKDATLSTARRTFGQSVDEVGATEGSRGELGIEALRDLNALYGVSNKESGETAGLIRPLWALTCTGYIRLVRHALDGDHTKTSLAGAVPTEGHQPL